MVDPINFTNYNRTDNELEETILFGLLVAGKNALTTSRLLDVFLRNFSHIGDSPFEIFSRFNMAEPPSLSVVLKDFGFGCYNTKAKGIYQLVRAGLNLRTCTVDDLEKIHSIGMKTSRLFVLHTRKNAQCIPLDVHILKFLVALGFNAPLTTPSNKKKYLELENIFIKLAKTHNYVVADLDLTVWRAYSSKNTKLIDGLLQEFYTSYKLVV
jgi:thermostable 8-oxoguanine DNA glycosylase